MIIGTIKETEADESRVAITPDTCKKFVEKGFDVCIEKNAGIQASFEDSSYINSGGKVLDKDEIIKKIDVLLTVNSIPKPEEIKKLKKGITIIGMFNPYENFKKLEDVLVDKLNLISLDFLPRISRAQSMDVLSSQANLAGYKAVIEASSIFKKALPMMMTAAGTIIPAKCLILGAGVAGLQAIATAKRLGCLVYSFDVRPEVEEQVKSLGAKFISVEEKIPSKPQTVYAQEMNEEYKQKQLSKIHDVAVDMDIIISTALIPGKKAPLLIEDKTIEMMKSGSVLVDLAASAGGNIYGSELGKKIYKSSTVIYAPANLPSLIAYDASLLYAKNIFNFLNSFIDEEKKINLETNDELLLTTLLVKDGMKTEKFFTG